MSAIDEFSALIENTEVVKQALRSLREEPAYLLSSICRHYENTGKPVPDHHLQLVGYMGEASLKGLVASGMVTQQPGGSFSLYCYEPTKEGQKLYKKLKEDGFYSK